MAVGANVITVEVTAEDGIATQTYTVTVTRADAPITSVSADASLSGLTLSGVTLSARISSRATRRKWVMAISSSKTTRKAGLVPWSSIGLSDE